jgi:hypothetical protein
MLIKDPHELPKITNNLSSINFARLFLDDVSLGANLAHIPTGIDAASGREDRNRERQSDEGRMFVLLSITVSVIQ